MTGLIDRLNAALDEDERIAREASPGPWHWDDVDNPGWGHQGPDLVSSKEEAVITSWGHDADGIFVDDGDKAHIARHDPARVLRQVEGARKTLALHQPVAVLNNDGVRVIGHECKVCFDSPTPYSEPPYSMADYPCPTILALAEMFGVEP